MSEQKREAGYSVDSQDWPVGAKHSLTSDQVIDVLNQAITPEKWAAAQQSLRDTPDDWFSNTNEQSDTVPR